jgi:hypothetical protein
MRKISLAYIPGLKTYAIIAWDFELERGFKALTLFKDLDGYWKMLAVDDEREERALYASTKLSTIIDRLLDLEIEAADIKNILGTLSQIMGMRT